MYAKLQAGLQGIGSLARETHELTVNRDVTGATCINQYVVVKTLGRGSYGKVKLCLNTLDGQLYAIKQASSAAALGSAAAGAPGGLRGLETMDEVSKEIAILKKLDHPNVVKLYEVIDPPGSQYMMLVMEYLEKGPVLQTRDQAGFERLPEEVAADYFRQAMKGLEYLHYHKVVHGDVKPENLLVSANGELKISDFGCSRMADGKTAQQRLSGTPAFTAPELVAGTSSDPFAADVWAMGACLYCFIYGQLPFQGGSVLDIFKAITSDPLELPGDVLISPDLRDLLHRLFDKDPAARITVRDIMEHPWVTDGGQLQLSQLDDGGSYGAIEVTAQEQQGAIDRASLVSMIRARLKEKTFHSGEYLFKQVRPARGRGEGWGVSEGAGAVARRHWRSARHEVACRGPRLGAQRTRLR
ncbi:MAG: kinase-like domain-containing protein [Monoraphidium minutum]|nr:MAG: kinase-like domain-containing protein [Monoraphidium minutum]